MEDCLTLCWTPQLRGHKEGTGERACFRADCPYPGCRSARSLEYKIRGKSIWWNSFCDFHDKDVLRPVLRGRVCLPGQVRTVSVCDVEELALSGMTSAQSINLALLELAGYSTGVALDKLGISRQNRPRIIKGRHRLKSETSSQVAARLKSETRSASNPRHRRR